MVRALRICIVICLLAVLMAAPCTASAATVYDGSISTTYTTIFRDILSQAGPLDDYVFYRSGQYEYTMVVGDITYLDGTFTGTELTQYTLYTNTSYNSSYDFSTGQLLSWELTPGTALIYASQGYYPELRAPELIGILSIAFGVALITVMFLLREIFRFTYRYRGGGN